MPSEQYKNMKRLLPHNIEALFQEAPGYCQVRDPLPVFIAGADLWHTACTANTVLTDTEEIRNRQIIT